MLDGEIKLYVCVLLVYFLRKMWVLKRNLNVKEWWCVKPERTCREEWIDLLGILDANIVAFFFPLVFVTFLWVLALSSVFITEYLKLICGYVTQCRSTEALELSVLFNGNLLILLWDAVGVFFLVSVEHLVFYPLFSDLIVAVQIFLLCHFY